MAKKPSKVRLTRHREWEMVKWQNAEKGVQHALEFSLKPKYEKEITNIFIATQESFLRDLPSHETPTMPFITGNLHDSIGSVVSVRGRVVRASYAETVAKTTSSLSGREIYKSTSGMGRKRIIGSQSAFNMVRSLQGKYPNNLAVTMFVAVPYALNPEVRGPHQGYLENLRKLFAYAFEREIRRAEAKHILQVNGTLDQYIKLAYDPNDIRVAEQTRTNTKKNSGYMGAAKPGMGMKMR